MTQIDFTFLGNFLTSPTGIIFSIVFFIVNVLLGLVIVKITFRGHKPVLCEKNMADRQETIHQLQIELAKTEEKADRLVETEIKYRDVGIRLESLQEQLTRNAVERARFEQMSKKIPELETALENEMTDTQQLQHSITQLKTDNAELQTRIVESRKNADEKLVLMQKAEKELAGQFENLANRILEEKTQRFSEQNKSNLNNLISPLREQLQEFKKKVEDVHTTDIKDRASLVQEIKGLRQQTQQINQEAVNLTRALKGDKKAQGNWGELILEKVLEQSGLRKGIEYETQGGFRDADAKLLKPDVIVHLPEEKDVIVDSKVSLLAYERYSSTDDETIQAIALKEHIDAIRQHIRSLSSKDYSGLKDLRSLDFVLMFMPIEAAFLVAFQHDETLFTDTFSQKIIVVTPTTLLATLRTIENIWRYERQNENAKIIADKAGLVYDKVRGFVEELEKLGNQLDTVHNTYDNVMNKLTRGKGNLIRQANSFVELGVKVKKKLPDRSEE